MIALALTLFSAAASAQLAQFAMNTAQIATAAGKVSIERGGEMWAVSGGQEIQAGQVMVTGSDGFAELALPDGSRLEIFPNSRFAFRANRFSLRDMIDLYLGKIRFHVQKLTKDDPSIRVTSPTAVISVRGTTFDVEVSPTESTIVSVEEGAVAVRHRLMPGQEVLVQGGESIEVIADIPLAAAKPAVPRSIVGSVVRAVGNTLAQIKSQRGTATAGGPASGPAAGSGNPGSSGGAGGGVSGSDSGSNEGAPPPSGGGGDDDSGGATPGDRLP
ncbi:MAG: hypothetical protein EXQ56_13770 [Acidobacteria bacterium]|nr:hypothetical protein [Acidobacteriota bacterium]